MGGHCEYELWPYGQESWETTGAIGTEYGVAF